MTLFLAVDFDSMVNKDIISVKTKPRAN